jgi:hypothetical protein
MLQAELEVPHMPKIPEHKSRFPDAPWSKESDEQIWEHAGLYCAVYREPDMGHLYGVVLLPPGHPWFGHPHKSLPHEAHEAAHGGVTRSEPASPEGWWIGFNCAQSRDLTPLQAVVAQNIGIDTKLVLGVEVELPSATGIATLAEVAARAKLH